MTVRSQKQKTRWQVEREFNKLANAYDIICLIRKIERKNLLLELSFCIPLFLVGCFMLMYNSSEHLENWELFINISGIGIIFLASVLLYHAIIPFLSKKHNLTEIILNRPKEIVWVYPLVTINMPFGIQFIRITTLYFCLANGKHFSMTTRLSRANLLMRLLKLQLPKATFGYSERKAFLFNTNKKLLL